MNMSAARISLSPVVGGLKYTKWLAGAATGYPPRVNGMAADPGADVQGLDPAMEVTLCQRNLSGN